MILRFTLFLLVVGYCAAAPAPSRRVSIERVVDSIIAVENTPWSHPGGALQFTQAAWREETNRPFSQARDPAIAVPLAVQRLERLGRLLLEGGVDPSVYNLAMCWRRGLDGTLLRIRKKITDDYAWRCRNLYEDPTFNP